MIRRDVQALGYNDWGESKVHELKTNAKIKKIIWRLTAMPQIASDWIGTDGFYKISGIITFLQNGIMSNNENTEYCTTIIQQAGQISVIKDIWEKEFIIDDSKDMQLITAQVDTDGPSVVLAFNLVSSLVLVYA